MGYSSKLVSKLSANSSPFCLTQDADSKRAFYPVYKELDGSLFLHPGDWVLRSVSPMSSWTPSSQLFLILHPPSSPLTYLYLQLKYIGKLLYPITWTCPNIFICNYGICVICIIFLILLFPTFLTFLLLFFRNLFERSYFLIIFINGHTVLLYITVSFTKISYTLCLFSFEIFSSHNKLLNTDIILPLCGHYYFAALYRFPSQVIFNLKYLFSLQCCLKQESYYNLLWQKRVYTIIICNKIS